MLNKIIYSDNGVLSDITAKLQDYYSGVQALTVVAAEDKIFLGSPFPFGRMYFKCSVANAIASTVTVKYWDGTVFRAASSKTDETGLAGTPFANNGYLSFVPDKRYRWVADDTTVDGVEHVTGFGTATYYGLFWVQLTYSGAITPTLSWFGDLFCTDSDLGSEYPSFNLAATKTAWTAGKTDWEEQRIAATEVILSDLKTRGVTESPGKLLSIDQLRRAAVSKTAEIIFAGMGEGYADSMESAAAEYSKRMDARAFDVDANENGLPDKVEQGFKVSRMYR